ncbi:MAG: helix-turn-helix domain-containing protein [Polyangiaceae bacterium]|nr:helix-turn-helix domain-containing protein [Polyangiaceae bacterium]
MFVRHPPLPIQDNQRNELTPLIANGKTPQATVLRARIVLMAAEGKSSGTIGTELQISRPTVQKWKSRFACLGIPGILEEAKRTGRPPKLSPDEIKD